MNALSDRRRGSGCSAPLLGTTLPVVLSNPAALCYRLVTGRGGKILFFLDFS